MISSMLSTMSTTSTLSLTSSAITLFAQTGVSEISIISVISLIALLSCSEILSASKLWNRRLSTMLNLAIMPMVVVFFAIVAFKVMAVLQ